MIKLFFQKSITVNFFCDFLILSLVLSQITQVEYLKLTNQRTHFYSKELAEDFNKVFIFEKTSPMNFSIQPTLQNEYVDLVPLEKHDFEELFEVASDPAVWEMHPNKERYQREVFQTFFTGALESKGAFLIIDRHSEEVLGSTRFYDFNENAQSIFIGYTFYGTKSWGKKINGGVKKMMLDYIFQYVDKVIFHVGKDNVRSVKAMAKLGAENLGEEEVAYFGEASKMNVVFQIKKEDWKLKQHLH